MHTPKDSPYAFGPELRRHPPRTLPVRVPLVAAATTATITANVRVEDHVHVCDAGAQQLAKVLLVSVIMGG